MRLPLFLAFLVPGLLAQAQVPCDVSITVTPPTCPDDSDAVITVVPNTPGQYSYFWYQDPTLQGPVAAGLPAGNYSVLVLDTSGCSSLIDTTITAPEVPPLGTITVTNITCAGNNDGTMTLTVNPGPYTWAWADDWSSTELTRDSLGPGVYAALISGGTCPSWIFAFLDDPGITIEGNTTYCPSDPPVLTVQNQWGFQPDTWTWSTGDSLPSITVAVGTAGQVLVTAVDTSTGCTVMEDVFLTMLPPPVVAFTAPDTLCQNSPGTGILLSSTADSLAWHWGSNGTSDEPYPVITFDQPYWQPITLQGYDTAGCGSAPIPDSVYVIPRLPAIFTAEQVPCTPGIQVRFDSEADSCAFFVGDRLIMNQCRGTYQVDLERYGDYGLTFYSTRPDHCDDTSLVQLEVRTVPVAFLPNAFTPNNDGINDTWPGELDVPDLNYEVHIFDRWGHSVWSTMDTQAKWDGSNLPMGVYVYTMRMQDPCNPKDEVRKDGFITLFR